jgi:hypothetical protein
MLTRRLVLLATVLVSALACAGAAIATGGTTVANAPVVQPGQAYFGNTATAAIDAGWWNGYEFWRIDLLTGDSLTVNFENTDGTVKGINVVYLYGPSATDYNLSPEVTGAQPNGSFHGQLQYEASAGGRYTLDFESAIYTPTDAYMGPYQFVAYVKHVVVLSASPKKLPRSGTLRVLVRHADGSAISDPGLKLSLFARINSGWRKVSGVAHPSAGKTNISFKLPLSAVGKKLKIRVVAQGASYKTTTLTRSIKVR